MRDLAAPERDRSFGLVVQVLPGFESRGIPMSDDVWGSLNHHDASPASSGEKGGLNSITNGRPGLAGPLAQSLLGRGTGTVFEVASGKANHGGVGSWKGKSGNSHFFGIEMAYAGINSPFEPMPHHVIDAAARWHASRAKAFGYSAEMVCQHFEYAEPHGRKVDLLRAALVGVGGVDGFRNLVQFYIDHPPFEAVEIPKVPYKLNRVLRFGMDDKDTPGNRIIFRCEQLLVWNANKYGYPTHNPGKVDGKFTILTADSVNSFRHWWWENIDSKRPKNERHMQGPEGFVIGQKVYDALNFAAVVPLAA